MPKQITQAELRECLNDETFVSRKMMQIRNRLQAGATVEPGELGAEETGGPKTIRTATVFRTWV
jgi:hypothetical protein